MRVLYLITVLAPAGAEQSLLAMAPRLAELGVDLQIAYLRGRPGLQDRLQEVGVPVTSLVGRGGVPGHLLRTVRLIRRFRPDLVHTTLTEANLVGRLAGRVTGVPVVSSLVNMSYGPEQRSAPGLARVGVRFRHLLDLLTAPLVTRFHAVTGPVAEAMATRLRVAPGRIDVVPRGRDPESLGRRAPERGSRLRAELNLGAHVPLVVSIAHQDYQKGLDVLVQAMSLVSRDHQDACLVVAGRKGNHTDELQALVERLGLHRCVRFLGLRHDIPELLCAADVFVLASRWEGMGGVLLEAMALEAPIVASDLATLRDSIPDHRYAVLVAANQPASLATAITGVLADREAAAERAALARLRFLERFTVETVAGQMLSFYERAVAASSAGASGTRGKSSSPRPTVAADPPG